MSSIQVKKKVMLALAGSVAFIVIILSFPHLNFFSVNNSGSAPLPHERKLETLSFQESSNDAKGTFPMVKSGVGAVESLQYAGGYYFVYIKAPTGIVIVATSYLDPAIKVGEQVNWTDTKPAHNYFSDALNKTFKTLYFTSISPGTPKEYQGVMLSKQERDDQLWLKVDWFGRIVTLISPQNNLRNIPFEIKPGTHIQWQPLDTDVYLADQNAAHRSQNNKRYIPIKNIQLLQQN